MTHTTLRPSLRRPAAALTAAGLLVTLGACSSDDDGSGTGNAPDGSIGSKILTDSDTPAGWEWTNAADSFDDGDADDISELTAAADSVVTDPEQCSAINPSTLSSLAVLHDNPDTTAAVGFLPQDETDPGVVNAMITTDPEHTNMALPDDLSECETFTRSSDLDPSQAPVTFAADVSDADVLGADDVHIFTVVSEDGDGGDGGDGGDPVSVVIGTVEGVTFRVDASGLDEPQILLDLVDRQVDRILGNDPDAN